MRWQLLDGTANKSVTVPATVACVNGQSWCYVAHIPFETRSVSGLTLPKTSGTLALRPAHSPITYTRSAAVSSIHASIAPPKTGTFTFSGADRGLLKRVDLLVSFGRAESAGVQEDFHLRQTGAQLVDNLADARDVLLADAADEDEVRLARDDVFGDASVLFVMLAAPPPRT